MPKKTIAASPAKSVPLPEIGVATEVGGEIPLRLSGCRKRANRIRNPGIPRPRTTGLHDPVIFCAIRATTLNSKRENRPESACFRQVAGKLYGRIAGDREYMAPVNEVEEKLAWIWQELLGIERVGTRDDFFELGGHSLKATVLAAKIHQEFEVNIALTEVFDNPTIQGLAGYIATAKPGRYSAIQPVASPLAGGGQEYYPVSAAQKRMYLLRQFEGESVAYNIAGAVLLEGRVNREQIDGWFTQLIARHETLRTSFELVDGEPVQRIHPEVAFAVEYLELPELESGSEQLREVIGGWIRPFNLGEAPLLRIKLVRLKDEKRLLFFDMHHIISDGISMGIIIKELAEISQNRELAELRIQYKDFAVWQNELFRASNQATGRILVKGIPRREHARARVRARDPGT